MPTKAVPILYIDDDPGLARLVYKALGRRGYAVENAATSEEGLARLAKGDIEAIALDHFLPTGTGLDFLEQLRTMPAPPPVVYVTGSGDTAVAVAALKAGAADYVAKATGEDFLDLLGTALDQAIAKSRLERARDEAEREVRAARDRAETLLHEVNHRVANSLALVAALVHMQARSIADISARKALQGIETRISAIAGVHRRLYTSQDVRSVEISEYLGSLINDLEATLKGAGRASTVRLVAEPIQVPTDKAVSIGVIVTELVTNAFKYAYPQERSGEIRVRCRETTPGQVVLAVEDDGVGWRGEGSPKGTGIGNRIVAAMARNLGSDVDYAQASGGCHVSLAFRLAPRDAAV